MNDFNNTVIEELKQQPIESNILKQVKISSLHDRKKSEIASHRNKDSMIKITRNMRASLSSDSINMSQASLTISDEAAEKFNRKTKE